MIAPIIGAVFRACAIAIAISTPSLFLVPETAEGSYIVLLCALCVGGLVGLEYLNTYPSVLEFRDARPYNRLRFVHAMIVIVGTSLVLRGTFDSPPARVLENISVILGHWLDFSYSPIRLVVLMLPDFLPSDLTDAMRMAAGFGFVLSVLIIFVFFTLIRLTNWPLGHGSFNVWTNLPLLDPTSGGDIVHRLTRDGRINILFGLTLPFIIPALVKTYSLALGPQVFFDPQVLAWLIILWTVFPTTCAMRGIAMLRIAELIQHKRSAEHPVQKIQIA